MKEPTAIRPFTDNSEFLDEAIGALHARCRRLAAERQLREAQRGNGGDNIDEALRRIATVRRQETTTKDALDARLAVHREEGSFVLGLDRLAAEADLGEDERTILLCCFVAALSENLAGETFADLDFGICIYVTVELLYRVLEADRVADRLRVRRMLDAEAPLRKHGLVMLDGRLVPDVPDSFNSATVRLTSRAFGVLVATEVAR